MLFIRHEKGFCATQTTVTDEDIMKNGSGIGIELFEVLVASLDRPVLHCIQIHVVIDEPIRAFHVAAKFVQLLRLSQSLKWHGIRYVINLQE